MRRRVDRPRRADLDLDEIKEDLLARGLISVPTKPTPAMIIAGVSVSGLSPERILRIYQAVLTAGEGATQSSVAPEDGFFEDS